VRTTSRDKEKGWEIGAGLDLDKGKELLISVLRSETFDSTVILDINS
jgi:hypothetical protein